MLILGTRYGVTQVLGRARRANKRISEAIAAQIASINEQPIVFFAHSDALSELNKAVLYVRENEQCNRLIVVHVWDSEEARQVRVLPLRSETLARAWVRVCS
jgi:hypothetical protein